MNLIDNYLNTFNSKTSINRHLSTMAMTTKAFPQLPKN